MVSFLITSNFKLVDLQWQGCIVVLVLFIYRVLVRHLPCGRHRFTCWVYNSAQNHVKSLLYELLIGDLVTSN